MCDPGNLAIGLAMSALSTGASMYGQMQQGKAAQAQANYQAAVLRNNQQIAEYQAQDAEKRGKLAEQQHRLKVSQLAGRQRAVMAGNGVVVDQGSALDILGDTAELGELDALTIRSNSAREAYGFRVQGMGFASDAGLALARGASARSAGTTGAFTSLLSGAGSVAEKWSSFAKKGIL